MTTITSKANLLFVINMGSGNNDVDYVKVIDLFFADKTDVTVRKIKLEGNIDCNRLKKDLLANNPSKVIAVGGDGTIKLLAEMLMDTDIPLGLLPAGSANGMAKDLQIPADTEAALHLIWKGNGKPIHLIRINDQLCIHLSDIGFNAYVVKIFDSMKKRGMLSYVKAAWKVLWKHAKMKAVFE